LTAGVETGSEGSKGLFGGIVVGSSVVRMDADAGDGIVFGKRLPEKDLQGFPGAADPILRHL